MAKRKTLLTSTPATSSLSSESRPQPNRSISLQETHSGVGLEELKEEASDDTNDDQSVLPPSGHLIDHHGPSSSFHQHKRGPFFGVITFGFFTFLLLFHCDSFGFFVAIFLEWPTVQLGTLCEDWSPSSVATDSESDRESDGGQDRRFDRSHQDDQSIH